MADPAASKRRRSARAGPADPTAAERQDAGRQDTGTALDGRRGEDATLELLTRGRMEVEGRLVEASNATLYCTMAYRGVTAACVYKPVAGERPLWDFPPGTLAGREVAAYAVSRAAGWDLVPPTVMRDGPFGPGMCQLWVDTDESADLIALSRSRDHAQLRDMAVFDAVVNNADRKIGHLLPLPDGRLYGCDHGVCFGAEYKLRTVLWQWRGRRLPARAMQALCRLQADLADGAGPRDDGAGGKTQGRTGQAPEDGVGRLAAELATLLTPDEVRATRDRVDLLIKYGVHPYPPENWPAVPWPPV